MNKQEINASRLRPMYQEMGIEMNTLGCVMLDVKGFEKAKSIFTPDMLYYSKEMSWIQGFVADPGHLTLLYGLLNYGPEYKDYIKKVLNGWHLDSLEVERFDKFDSPEGSPYYCVMAKMKLTPGILEAHQRISLLPHINTFLEYVPHITIAYIHKDDALLSSVLKQLNSQPVSVKPIEIWADNNSGNKLKIGLLQ